MRKYKTEFIATAIFLVLGVISICICRRHFDVRIFNQDEMYVSENWTDAVDGKGIISDKLQGNTGKGTGLETSLQRGTHEGQDEREYIRKKATKGSRNCMKRGCQKGE